MFCLWYFVLDMSSFIFLVWWLQLSVFLLLIVQKMQLCSPSNIFTYLDEANELAKRKRLSSSSYTSGFSRSEARVKTLWLFNDYSCNILPSMFFSRASWYFFTSHGSSYFRTVSKALSNHRNMEYLYHLYTSLRCFKLQGLDIWQTEMKTRTT